ncbi:Lrp/AsnC family transcriptional regulator [Thermococcus sp.]|uniref:Lrp/AsnC family transcriptional regulator n=1 Tax=Thermococcus sp. TaxID=35749 RepID=UPI00260204F6|nr:Lrp/AsnC family transcriptional regulator [Thermococcus sp.]
MVQLDDLDRAILRILKEDARLTISEIAEKLNRPESTIHFRIKKLQEKGVIERYTIVLGKELQPKALAIVYIQAETPIIEDFLERYIRHIIRTLALLPNVLMVARSGADGIVALVGAENQEKLNRFVDETIRVLPTLRRVEVFPVDEIGKGSGVVGFLVDV